MVRNLLKSRFAAFFALLITMVVQPTMSKAQKAYVVEDGTTLTFYYDDQRANRTGTVYGIGSTQGNTTITKAVFDASFKNYRPTSTAYWFQGCSKLETFEGIENLNTSKVTSMCQMFYGCSALTSLDLSNFNTENVTDMLNMFFKCSALTALDLSNFNTQNVTDMGSMFSECSALTALDVSSFKTDNVTSMTSMFRECSSLSSLDVSGFNTEKVTSMSFMFSYCTSLTSLDLSNFNTANVTGMGFMFSYCTSLTSLDLSNFNTANVTGMTSMFWGCSALSSLDVSSFNTSKVTSMKRMFMGCKLLTSLDLSNFNTAIVTDMEYMFANCSSLTTIYCSDTWACSESTNMFSGCTSLKGAVACDSSKRDVSMANPDTGYFTVPTNDLEAYAIENDNVLTFYYDRLRDTRTGTAYIPLSEHQWTGSDITKADFDLSFKNYAPTSTAYWFDNCSKLEAIEGLNNLNTANVTDMSSMFCNCNSLTSLDLSNFNTANVTNMSSIFSGCSSLTALDVSEFNTENVTDMSSMFSGCSLLTLLDVSNFNTENVTTMASMFSGCSAITTIYCNDNWTCSESTNMFLNCINLKGAVEYDADYVDVSMANSETGYFTLQLTTSVSEINADSDNRPTGIYNLHGVKMHDDLQSLPAGIYIVNGKKVIVK